MAAPMRNVICANKIFQRTSFHLNFAKFASRKAKREKKLAARRERLLARQANPWSQKSAFIQEQKDRQEALLRRNKQAPSKWPLIPSRPEDDVWLSSMYPPQLESIRDALSYLRQLNDQSVLDNENDFVHLLLDLDLQLQKNKYLESVKGMIRIPHFFSEGESLRIVALSQVTEQQEKAIAAGAQIAGGEEIIHDLQSGKLSRDEFDMIVASPEMSLLLLPMKKILKGSLPTLKQGAIGNDLSVLVDKFLHGKYYKVVNPLKEDKGWGTADVIVGPLNMPMEHLEENIHCFTDAISSHKSLKMGPFITSAVLKVENQPDEVSISLESSTQTDEKKISV